MPNNTRSELLRRIAAQEYPDSHRMLCFSGMHSQNSGSRSLYATNPAQLIQGNTLDMLPKSGEWFGWLGYGLRCDIESLNRNADSYISVPDCMLFRPQHVEQIEHEASEDISGMPCNTANVSEIASNMSKADYLRIVEATLENIAAGSFYQANITRKFHGTFDKAPDAFALFCKLCEISPSPYAAFVQANDCYILSSSPEGFLESQPSGRLTVRPVKGTAAVGTGGLSDSDKDRAENLMIVDLMRNDLSRVCVPESVTVDALFEVHDFATVRQMISTISGNRSPDADMKAMLRATFPPGSMTGAPKIAAMRWCDEQERIERGIYSGALGWMNMDTKACDLSVVIRTLIIQGNRFEFQVGGGIVADSDPEAEWEESLLKARAICRLLDIPEERLRML